MPAAVHVVQSCVRIDLLSEGVPTLHAAVEAGSLVPDLALLRVMDAPAGWPPATLRLRASDVALAEGERLTVLGYPMGGPLLRAVASPLEVLVTPALRRLNPRAATTLFRGYLTHGDSGGPVLDGGGRVVAVATNVISVVSKRRAGIGDAEHDPRWGDESDLSTGQLSRVVRAFYRRIGFQGPSSGPVAATVEAARPAVMRAVCWRN